jgi:tetratricopeptide (TPR) repeat protein
VARYEAADAAEAARAFAAAAVRARAPEDVALANYDLGVALLELGDFAGARDAFFDALAYAPNDAEAAFNLEWALRALDSDPPPPPEAPRPSQDTPPEPRAEPDPTDEPEASPPPMPSPTAEPEPQAPPDDEGRAESHERPTALSPEEVERWLESLRDEPPRPSGQPKARSGPQW